MRELFLSPIFCPLVSCPTPLSGRNDDQHLDPQCLIFDPQSLIFDIAKVGERNYIPRRYETWSYYQPAYLGRIVVFYLPMAKFTTYARKR
jgi:hypothetical protein